LKPDDVAGLAPYTDRDAGRGSWRRRKLLIMSHSRKVAGKVLPMIYYNGENKIPLNINRALYAITLLFK
jgi:hypothetical protein